MNIKELLASNIKAIMEVRGFNQPELAKLTGVSQAKVNNILKKKSYTSTEILENLAHGLRVPVAVLLLEDPNYSRLFCLASKIPNGWSVLLRPSE